MPILKSPFSLHLRGPARLERGGEPLAPRRKGLALLYILALEGPTRRERLADLLWGHGSAANNLRVELHRLRKLFEQHSVRLFEAGADPLILPSAVTLEASGTAEIMEGLEDLTPEFTEWLEIQRAIHDAAEHSPTSSTSGLVEELLTRVSAPAVLVLRLKPGSSAAPLAKHLATKLKLPFVSSAGTGGAAVHLLSAEESPELWRTIAQDNAGVWVLERQSLGEDPPLLLTLRARLPAERLSYFQLPPLPWWEARTEHLASFPFEAAARHYLASGGHRGYLQELTSIPNTASSLEVQVPQRVRAAYLLEAQKLSAGAKLALERLSVMPGTYDQALLTRLAITPHLDEIERSGWLAWDGRWRFTDEAARTVLSSSLQRGRKQRYEEEARGSHPRLTGQRRASQNGTRHSELPTIEVGLGGIYGGWSCRLIGEGATRRGNRIAVVRSHNNPHPSGLSLQFIREPLVLHLKGSAYASAEDAQSQQALLELRHRGSRETIRVEPLPAEPTGETASRFDHWFHLHRLDELRLESRAGRALLELEFTLYFAISDAQPRRHAFNLSAANGTTEERETSSTDEPDPWSLTGHGSNS